MAGPDKSYVEVAVNVPLVAGLFHYHLPPELFGRVEAGCLVQVPFGAKEVQGVVIRPIAEPQVPETRPVTALLDPQPVLTSFQLDLAFWLSEYYLAPLAACIDRMLPPGLSQHTETIYSLEEEHAEAALAASRRGSDPGRRLAEHLLAAFERNRELRGRQLERRFPHQPWRRLLQGWEKEGLLTSRSVLPPPAVRAKTARTVQLACSVEAAQEVLPNLARAGSAALTRRQAALRFLITTPWPVEVAWVYAQSGAKWADLQELEERGLIALGETEVWRDPLSSLDNLPDHPFPLTHDQQSVWEPIQDALRSRSSGVNGGERKPFLLHGVTGSGKTEIYLQAVAETLRLGRQAIILVPEIALTAQTIRRFMARFPGQVALVHSRLSEGERYDTWRRVRAGLLPVVVGPRSALFVPLSNPGLIVVDEFHDESYFQDEMQPYYHAVTAALKLARLTGAACLLGSATPDVALTYQARSSGWQTLSLPDRILAHREAVARQASRLGHPVAAHPYEAEAASLDLPEVHLVDMRQELKQGNRHMFSRLLKESLTRVLADGHQAILFLNRRGTATYVFCRECGQALHCPRCDIPLTLHSPQGSLICHHCGYRRLMPKTCPACGSSQIRQFGTGTERVESEVQALFPQARTLRWDAETTRQKGAHEIILSHFAAHRADVLVGTQMLAKGLDLPFVTLVGVVLADVGLNLPDYRAAERTFQVLTQVAGRAGRSPLGGKVIMQTFQPGHYALQAAARHDFAAFYEKELGYRRLLGYPPFYRLVRLEYRHARSETAEKEAQKLAGQIGAWLDSADRGETEIIGPVPCFFSRLHGLYRWQIILRGPNPASLLRGRPLGDWHVEVDPPNLL
ncbi:MAG: primosomal protein N' [Chloroflexi bacterium]|nr:primosomal protein N' [Chloroflexota bacterium]